MNSTAGRALTAPTAPEDFMAEPPRNDSVRLERDRVRSRVGYSGAGNPARTRIATDQSEPRA